MSPPRDRLAVFTEHGSKRVFAGAVEWPGWCRSARREDEALEALVAYGLRYAAVLDGSGLELSPPASAGELEVRERLDGTATTDFGAPDVALASDARRVPTAELERLCAILEACWAALDRSAAAARGSDLRKGPRGGGRSLEAIVEHVLGAESSYLGRLAAPKPEVDPADLEASAAEIRAATLAAVRRAVTEGLPEAGPRGGKIWLPRYFVRRDAWHVLDHAWEIEDRTADGR